MEDNKEFWRNLGNEIEKEEMIRFGFELAQAIEGLLSFASSYV